MKKNIALVGCGHWGKNLLRNFYELGTLRAICDPNEEIARTFSDKYKVDCLSYDEILINKNINGVVLAVPAPLHATMAIEAMNAGKHVFVEKPLALNEVEANEMIANSLKNNVQLMVGHLLQYHPVFIKIREIIKSNKLGKLNYIYSNRLSFGKVRSEENVIWSFAPHDISMILSLTPKNPLSVRAESSCILNKSIADKALVQIDFESNLKAHISISWLHPYKEQKLVIIGSKGSLVFDDTKEWDEKLIVYPHEIDLSKKLPLIQQSSASYIQVKKSEPLKNECKHFLDVVNNFIKPLTNGEEGLAVLKILNAADKSQKIHKSVKI